LSDYFSTVVFLTYGQLKAQFMHLGNIFNFLKTLLTSPREVFARLGAAALRVSSMGRNVARQLHIRLMPASFWRRPTKATTKGSSINDASLYSCTLHHQDNTIQRPERHKAT
jgi:hypothetical protein